MVKNLKVRYNADALRIAHVIKYLIPQGTSGGLYSTKRKDIDNWNL